MGGSTRNGQAVGCVGIKALHYGEKPGGCGSIEPHAYLQPGIESQAVLEPVSQTADCKTARSQAGHVCGDDCCVGVSGDSEEQAQLAGPNYLVDKAGSAGDKETDINNWSYVSISHMGHL